MFDVSVVVIFESTPSFQADLTFCSRASNCMPAGISQSTLPQACSAEMKETPTLEVTLVELNVNTAPTRAVEF